jgi:glycosyltransferase involved in cell wall biosynthesis
MPKLARADERVVAFVPRGWRPELPGDAPALEVVSCEVKPGSRSGRVLWEQTRLAGVLRRAGVDVTLFPYAGLPYGWRGPSVVTLHDAVTALAPGTLGVVERSYKRLMEWLMRRARCRVIFPSRAGLGVLEGRMGFEPGLLHAVAHGVDEALLGSAGSLSPAGRAGVLWVGRPYATKNLPTLLEAFARLLPTLPEMPAPVELTLVGAGDSGRLGERLREAVRGSGLGDRVKVLAGCDRASLRGHYTGARVLACPSTVESFGLPVLEAMACGTPVACSDLPVFEEIAGDAALRTPAMDPGALACSLRGLLVDDELWLKQASRGRERAAELTWDRCVRGTLEVLRLAAGREV